MFFILHIWNIAVASLILYFLYSRLRYLWDKQDKGVLFAFFIAGCFSIGIHEIIFTFYPLNYFFPFFRSNDFLYYVFITGITEESSKFLAFIILAHSLKSIKEPQDGVIQGAVVGLAFGVIENCIYFSRYPNDWFLILRPIFASSGHAVYGGIWGGLYSAAIYSNLYSKEPRSYLLAFYGLFGTALIHGLYNASYSFVIGTLIDIGALIGTYLIFLRLVDNSPYRKYLLSDAKKAIPNIRRGLHFNPKSSILNRGLGHFLMYQGKYKQAAKHLTRSMPSAYDSRKARFFVAVCDMTRLPEYNAKKSMRVAWGRLSDEQRVDYMSHLERLLLNDPVLLERVKEYINDVLNTRVWMAPHKLADELRRRKAERRIKKSANPTFGELASQLSKEERERLASKLK